MFKTASRPEPLTPLQRDCVGVIAEYRQLLGRSPTHREICRELDLRGRSQANRLVQILTDKGWLRPRRHGLKYALELLAHPVLPLEGPVEMTTAGRAFVEARAEA